MPHEAPAEWGRGWRRRPEFRSTCTEKPPSTRAGRWRSCAGGGYEALREGFPQGRGPDLLPPGWNHAGVHPTAGASCVGARRLLLAWNVYVEGLGLSTVKEIARRLRETGGGFAGLRALGLELPSRGRLQISMNLEDIVATSPFTVFEAVEDEVEARAGRNLGRRGHRNDTGSTRPPGRREPTRAGRGLARAATLHTLGPSSREAGRRGSGHPMHHRTSRCVPLECPIPAHSFGRRRRALPRSRRRSPRGWKGCWRRFGGSSSRTSTRSRGSTSISS